MLIAQYLQRNGRDRLRFSLDRNREFWQGERDPLITRIKLTAGYEDTHRKSTDSKEPGIKDNLQSPTEGQEEDQKELAKGTQKSD